MREENDTGRFVREVCGDLREQRVDERRIPAPVADLQALLLDTSRNPDGCG